MDLLISIMVYLGSALMVYNIVRCYGFLRRTRDMRAGMPPGRRKLIYVPLVLLVSFLVGYLVVGYFGNPDLVVGGILFGGSVFVFIVLGIMYNIIDRLRESNEQAGAMYDGLRDGLDSLTQSYVEVMRVNLTTDEIEERSDNGEFPVEGESDSFSELMELRRRRMTSEPRIVEGNGQLTREGLLACFAAGRTTVEEVVRCEPDDRGTCFLRVQARMAREPRTQNVIAFITEEIYNDQLVSEALLNKALIGQFDMITYVMDGNYSVVIGDPSTIRYGSIFPRQKSGSYEQYLREQVAPVIRGTDEERAEQLACLSPDRVEQGLSQSEPYVVDISCFIDGSVYYKRFVFYVVDWDARFFLLLKSDTTEVRQEEIERNERLQEALEEAQRASESKTTFLSNMSHDIRTPMNAIVGYTEFARRSDDREEMHTYLDKIDASSKYLLALINDVLEMSRIESGKLELEPEDTDLCQVMGDLKDMFDTQMADKGIRFVVEGVNVTNCHVRCDRTRLNRVLLNLLSNAYKFTPEGGSVRVTLAELDGAPEGWGDYELRVRDTGIGMSPEFAQRVFETFERDRNTTVSGIQGTGLGMAITKRIVDMMGGTIEVRSKQGEGTEFVVRLRLELLEDADALASETVDAEEPAELMDFEGVRVLLVEDNEINREIACILLEDLGFVLEMAVDGQDAVDRLVAAGPGAFDVVITDIQMPVMNGYEEARAIRALDDPELARIPIIAMSANAFQEDIAEARRAGMNGYVPKPIDVGIVISELSRVLA